MTKYHIVVTTSNPDDKSKLLASLKLAEAKTEESFKIQVIEHPDDPAEESGDYILWYHSASHQKVRYYVGAPESLGEKPRFTYKKKEAVKLSQTACKLIAVRLTMAGYSAVMQIGKGGADLTVVTGEFNKAVEDLKEAVGDPESISPHTPESIQEIADALVGDIELSDKAVSGLSDVVLALKDAHPEIGGDDD
jgi:hypothetical protein